MKMKKHVNLNSKIRNLLLEKSARQLIITIFSHRDSPLPIHIYLSTTNNCINTANENCYNSPYELQSSDSNDLYTHCYKTPEYAMAGLLLDDDIIKGSINGTEDGFFQLTVLKINKRIIQAIYAWAINSEYIYNYGPFYLNTHSGIAYFNNHQARFRPGSKYSEVLKSLISNNNHFLTFEEMDLITSTKPKDKTKSYDHKDYAIYIAKYIRKKLRMVKGAGKMLHIHDGKGFMLEETRRK